MNSAVFVALPLAAFTGALMYLLPYLTPRRYFFTITVPPDLPSSETGRAILSAFHGRMTAVILFSLAGVWPLAAVAPRLAILYGELLPVIGGIACYLLGRNRARPYSVSAAPVREAEVSTAADRLPRWIALALPPFAAPAAAALWLRAHWGEIPVRFAVHYNIQGEPNRWAEKTTRGVYGPLLAGAGLMLLILLLALAMFHGARRGPQRTAVLKIEVALVYYLAYVFTAASLMAVLTVPLAAHLVPTALFLVILLAWCFKLSRDPGMPVDTTPDEYWHLGSFYYNPQDPAIFVQKRMGFGYTLNFGNRLSWIMLGSLLAGVLALMLVLPK
jgi:uncharacterized membrane protein